MKYNCIACGKKITGEYCQGEIKGLVVTFCKEDSIHCKNCETMACHKE